MNELDKIKADVDKLANSIHQLKMLHLFKNDELDTLENNGLKEICEQSKHTIEDIVYTTHKEIVDTF